MRAWHITSVTFGLALLACVPAAPATAMPGPIPAATSRDCGEATGNYAACVTVRNSTRGYESPNVASLNAGLRFVADFSASANSSGGLSQGHALGSAGNPQNSSIGSGGGWVAYWCRIAWPFTHGCRSNVSATVALPTLSLIREFTMLPDGILQARVLDPRPFRPGDRVTISGARWRGNEGTFTVLTASVWGSNPRYTTFTVRNPNGRSSDPRDAAGLVRFANEDLQAQVRERQGNQAVRAWGQVNYRRAPTMACATSRYVGCTALANQGPQRWTRFNFALTNELVTIGVTNTLANYRLVLRHEPAWGKSIEDTRGRSANAQRIEPGGQAFWGAIRPINKKDTHITVEYEVQSTGVQQALNGARVRLRIDFDKEGKLITTGSADDAHGPEACSVQAGYTGRPTCEVNLAASGWVPGQTTLRVSVGGRG